MTLEEWLGFRGYDRPPLFRPDGTVPAALIVRWPEGIVDLMRGEPVVPFTALTLPA